MPPFLRAFRREVQQGTSREDSPGVSAHEYAIWTFGNSRDKASSWITDCR